MATRRSPTIYYSLASGLDGLAMPPRNQVEEAHDKASKAAYETGLATLEVKTSRMWNSGLRPVCTLLGFGKGVKLVKVQVASI